MNESLTSFGIAGEQVAFKLALGDPPNVLADRQRMPILIVDAGQPQNDRRDRRSLLIDHFFGRELRLWIGPLCPGRAEFVELLPQLARLHHQQTAGEDELADVVEIGEGPAQPPRSFDRQLVIKGALCSVEIIVRGQVDYASQPRSESLADCRERLLDTPIVGKVALDKVALRFRFLGRFEIQTDKMVVAGESL